MHIDNFNHIMYIMNKSCLIIGSAIVLAALPLLWEVVKPELDSGLLIQLVNTIGHSYIQYIRVK